MASMRSRSSTGAMIKQPDPSPISASELAAEIKAIYAGLTLVETKCISVANQIAVFKEEDATKRVTDWPSLIAFHRALLHEHHDLFLASQHPSARWALRDLTTKYNMPVRMWRHGIHNFLELLRHELPTSLEYMLAFIYLAYQMMALLYETVPSLDDTWIECMGDLARSQMAIEDENIRDRDVWTDVAKYWFQKATRKRQPVGRLHHHLAMLSRTHNMSQLSHCLRALDTQEMLSSLNESINNSPGSIPIKHRTERRLGIGISTSSSASGRAQYQEPLDRDRTPRDWFDATALLALLVHHMIHLLNMLTIFFAILSSSAITNPDTWGHPNRPASATLWRATLKTPTMPNKKRKKIPRSDTVIYRLTDVYRLL